MYSYYPFFFLSYYPIAWGLSSLQLAAWSLALRRFCPPDERHVPWSSLFLVKDLDSIGGLLHRRSTLDPRSCECRPARLLLTSYCVPQDQGSSFLKYFPQQSRHKNCEHNPQFHRRFHKYQLPKLNHLGNAININTCSKTNIHNQNVI